MYILYNIMHWGGGKFYIMEAKRMQKTSFSRKRMRMYLETFAVVALWLVLVPHDQALLALLASGFCPNSAQEVLFLWVKDL